MSLLPDTTCQRCRHQLSLSEITTINMCRVFYTTICNSCRNDWERYIRDCPIWQRIREFEITAAHLHARTCHDGIDRTAELIELHREVDQLSKQLFEIAETWVALGEPPPSSH